MTKDHLQITGLVLCALGAQIASLPNWQAALAPLFIGGTIVMIGTVIKAFRTQPQGGQEVEGQQ